MSNDTYKETRHKILSMHETLMNSSKDRGVYKAAEAMYVPKSTNCDEIYDENKMTESGALLEYVERHYYAQRRDLGMLKYDPMRTGCFSGQVCQKSLPFPYSVRNIEFPRPFLPRLSFRDINATLTIRIGYEFLDQLKAGGNTRYQNREIWGTDIYTDDSDILPVLQHCGFLTPVTSHNTNHTSAIPTESNYITNIHEMDKAFDLEVKILLLPPLNSYKSSTRNEITSREWTGAIHDGLSYGICSIEVKSRDGKMTKETKENCH